MRIEFVIQQVTSNEKTQKRFSGWSFIYNIFLTKPFQLKGYRRHFTNISNEEIVIDNLNKQRLAFGR